MVYVIDVLGPPFLAVFLLMVLIEVVYRVYNRP